jgi:hypothetical protein
MAQILRMILLVSYGLGLVSLGMGLVIRFIPGIVPASVSPRGALVFAATLFLCSVASHFAAGAAAQAPEAAPKAGAARA